MRSTSIRLRLSLLYTAILALTLIAFGATLYVAQSRAVYDGIRADLARQAAGVERANGQFPGPGGGPPLPGEAPPGTPPGASLPSGTLRGRWTQTRSVTGEVLGRSLDLSSTSLPLSEEGLQAIRNGSGWYETAQVEDQPALIYSRPYTAQDGVLQIVQIAFPTSQPQESLNTLRWILVAGSSLAIIAAFVLGWVLAGTALSPIHRITQTAQAIGAEHNFSRRVDHSGPADEVGQLAITFNDMLAELEAAYRQLEAALESQKRFVADASHELRTPLTTVRGNIELLRREPPVATEERAEILADTTDEVDRLIRLVNQLLLLARADAGRALQRETFPLRPLLEDVCRQARLLAPNSAIHYEPAPDAWVEGDRDGLKQVLLILADNAGAHSAPGATIEISTRQRDESVAMSVRDTGPGIPPDVLPHIFERFYRGEVARSSPGAGLGLSIAKELVEAQGGAIRVESTPGQGSVFTVILPAAATQITG
jgi:two-component system, OmpR family, sensor kinase